jgi:soluble lytic murein transglycosylase-like protein
MKRLACIPLLVLLLGSADPVSDITRITPPPGGYIAEEELAPEPVPDRLISDLSPMLEAAAAEAGIPVAVLERIAWAESRNKPWALSPVREDRSRDMGLFQFNSHYQDDYELQYGRFDPMDGGQAARAAAAHLAYLRKTYGSWPEAILRYNDGESRKEYTNFKYLAEVWGHGI